MNILFFLTPKKDVVYVNDVDNIKEVMEVMKKKQFSAIPILNNNGNFVGTIKEGDLLWYIEGNKHKNWEELSKVNIMDVPMRGIKKTVRIDTDVEELFQRTLDQNFVSVMDDSNIFIGIVKRRDILAYCYKKISKIQK